MSAKIVFSLLMLAAVIGMRGQGPRSKASRNSLGIPTVSLCSLLSKPADYDGKEIRVRAIYNVGFEWSFFDDAPCKKYAVETTPYRAANIVWAEFDNSVERSSKSEIYEKFRHAEGFCCPDGWRTKQTELVVTGKFFKAASTDIGKGYGHMGRYVFKIVVNKVEEVGATTMTSP